LLRADTPARVGSYAAPSFVMGIERPRTYTRGDVDPRFHPISR
jgi:hypothetical protein